MMRRSGGLVAAAIAALCGCTTVFQGQGGYFAPTSSREGHRGAAAQASFHAVSRDEQRWTLGVGWCVRGKFADELIQGAIATEAIALAAPGGVAVPYLRGGMHVVQVEQVDGEAAFGMFSPYAEAGVMLRVRRFANGDRWFVTVGAAIEYDVRFSDADDGGYFMLLVGGASAGPLAVGKGHETPFGGVR